MQQPFLTAEWRNLLMANYVIDPSILKKYIPVHTELDAFNDNHYISLVGFLFTNTRVKGFSFPFHKKFEEVNLRFYVRYKEDSTWKRGVVFIKELVPKRMITFVANTIYKEKYATHAMRHNWQNIGDDLSVEYYWKVGNEWDHIKAIAEKKAQPIVEGSEEEFITEHYWGYTCIDDKCTGEYRVTHPKWNVHQVKKFDIKCNAARLYGKEFIEPLSKEPKSFFLAEGSAIEVLKGKKIISTLI